MPADPALVLRRPWLAIGWLLVGVVIYLSITPSPPVIDTDIQYFDKWGHLAAYCFLMVWFGQIYHETQSRSLWLVGLIALGITLEFLQEMGGVRYFEYADMVANTSGAILGWWFSRGAGGEFLTRLERRMRL